MRFHTLDGMRGIAALAVVTVHFQTRFGWLEFDEGRLAVDLFFCLSGFVIAAAYGEKLGRGMRWFMGVRLVRLYPLYALGAALGLVAYWQAPDEQPIIAALLAAFMLPSFGVYFYPLDPAAWSLFPELVVNFFWARFRGVPGWMVLTIISGSLLAMAAATALTREHTFAIGYSLKQMPFGIARAFFSFPIGVALYRAWLRKGSPKRQSTPTVIALLIVVGLLLFPAVPISIKPLYELLTAALVFPALVYLGAVFGPGRHLAEVCGTLGAVSYGVYILHEPLGTLLPLGSIQAPLSGIMLIALLMAITWLLDRFFDMPTRRWLGRFLDRQTSTPLTLQLPHANLAADARERFEEADR